MEARRAPRDSRSAAIVAAATIASTGPAAGAATPQARVSLLNAAGAVVGEVVFKGHGSHTDQVQVDIYAPAAPGQGAFHGLHVHTTGACNPNNSGSANVPFGSAGGHWNLGAGTHGSHTGDLPSVLLTVDGETHVTFETQRFQVADLFDADGSAVVLHVGPDNFGNVPAGYTPANATVVTGTQATGDAGGRYACGVVTSAR